MDYAPDGNIESPILSVEILLEQLGGFSWFQLWAMIIIVAPELSASMISLSPILTNSQQFCCNTTLGEYQSTATANFSVPQKTIVQEWNLRGRTAWIAELFISLQMLGALFGAVLSGQFAERYGRKKAHFGLCFLMGVFSFASGWAQDPYTFGILRFLSGFSVGGCYVVYLNYLMEFLTPSYRTICGCVSLWAVGELMLALIGYLLQSWREILWATSAPAFLVILAYRWMPESPRWLLCQGRTEDALEVFEQIARWNGKPSVDPSDIKNLQRVILLGHDDRSDRLGRHSVSTSTIIEDKRFCSSFTLCSSFSIFCHKEYRFQLMLLMFLWFTSQLIYYGISFNMKNLSGDAYMNIFYMAIIGMPGSFTGLIFNNRLGRRTTIIGFAAISLCLLIALITIDETNLFHQNHHWILFLCLSVRLFVAAGFAVLSCFTAESFPTTNRVGCMGICALVGNIGGILAPQFVYVSTIVNSTQYITFGILSLVSILLALNLKEVTGMPLEDFLKQRKPQKTESIASIHI